MNDASGPDERMRRQGGRAVEAVVSSYSAAAEMERRPPPILPRFTVYLLLALLGASAAWASLSEVDRIVVARGTLEPTTPNMTVQPLETAVVRAINVEPGQIVRKGAALVTLDSTFTDADVAQTRTRLASLKLQMARIEAQLDGKDLIVPEGAPTGERAIQTQILEKGRAEYEARLQSHEDKIKELRATIDTNAIDRESLARQHKTLKEIESMRAQLYDSQHGSRLLMLAARKERQDAERRMDLATKRAVELRYQLDGAISIRDSFKAETRKTLTKELIEVKRDHDALNEKLTIAERRRALVVLRAPEDAVILDVAPKSLGSVAREAESLVTMVPLNTPLRARVNVRTQDIGFIRIGDKVVLKLDAFPFQKHGTIEGTVATISEDAFADKKDEKAEPFYRVTVEFKTAGLKAVPPDLRLLPGMAATAEIRIGSRTVMSYLTYPLIRSLDEAMREP